MSIGLEVKKSRLDEIMGNIARNFQLNFNDVATIKEWLDATPDVDIEAMGYTNNEVATIKTAFADLYQLRSIWRGETTLTDTKNFQNFVRRLWGAGVT